MMLIFFIWGYAKGLDDGYADGRVSGGNAVRAMFMINDKENGNGRNTLNITQSDIILHMEDYQEKNEILAYFDPFHQSYVNSYKIFKETEDRYINYLIKQNKIDQNAKNNYLSAIKLSAYNLQNPSANNKE